MPSNKTQAPTFYEPEKTLRFIEQNIFTMGQNQRLKKQIKPSYLIETSQIEDQNFSNTEKTKRATEKEFVMKNQNENTKAQTHRALKICRDLGSDVGLSGMKLKHNENQHEPDLDKLRLKYSNRDQVISARVDQRQGWESF